MLEQLAVGGGTLKTNSSMRGRLRGVRQSAANTHALLKRLRRLGIRWLLQSGCQLISRALAKMARQFLLALGLLLVVFMFL